MAVIVLEDSDLIFYYTGCHVDDGFAVCTQNGAHLFTDLRYYDAVCKVARAKVHLLSNLSLVDFLKGEGALEVSVVMEYTSAKLYKTLIENGFTVTDATSLFYQKAKVKTQDELNLLKQSASICEKAFINTLPYIKEGVSELELSAMLEYNFKLLGASKPSFETIVAFGSGSAVPHYQTSNVKLTKNSVILMDFGCYFNGYASDMTRTLYFGAPNKEFVERYDMVLSAHELAIKHANAGATGKSVDGLVREYFKKFGAQENFTHSLGHGVGVKIHEEPRLSKLNDTALEEGNVFTIEPGLYFNGEYGIRIEDTFAIINGKCQSLFTIDKKLITIQ